jgi:hypothetical protein
LAHQIQISRCSKRWEIPWFFSHKTLIKLRPKTNWAILPRKSTRNRPKSVPTNMAHNLKPWKLYENFKCEVMSHVCWDTLSLLLVAFLVGLVKDPERDEKRESRSFYFVWERNENTLSLTETSPTRISHNFQQNLTDKSNQPGSSLIVKSPDSRFYRENICLYYKYYLKSAEKLAHI